MMAAARASEWARKAKMAADRAGTAARSMELAGFGLVWALLWPLLSTPVLAFLFWVCLALLWHLYITIILFYLVLSPPAFVPRSGFYPRPYCGLYLCYSLTCCVGFRPCCCPPRYHYH